MMAEGTKLEVRAVLLQRLGPFNDIRMMLTMHLETITTPSAGGRKLAHGDDCVT